MRNQAAATNRMRRGVVVALSPARPPSNHATGSVNNARRPYERRVIPLVAPERAPEQCPQGSSGNASARRRNGPIPVELRCASAGRANMANAKTTNAYSGRRDWSCSSCERLPHEERATDGDQSSGDAQVTSVPTPAMHRADTDSQRVQAAGCNDETHAVEQRALAGWQFSSMRMPVEYGEESRPTPQRQQEAGAFQTVPQHPEELPTERFRIRFPASGTPIRPKHPTERHYHWKCNRQNPNRRSTELRAPQAYRNHRQHVIESGDRMAKAGEESQRLRPSADGRRPSAATENTSAHPASGASARDSGLCPGFASFVWR